MLYLAVCHFMGWAPFEKARWLCLLPVLRLAVRYLLYKITAFLAGTLGNPALTGLIDNLGGAFGLVLGMTGACAVLLLISTITSVMVVTG